MLRSILLGCAGLCAALVAYLLVLTFPDVAFAYHHAYRGFRISSDRPIDGHIDGVIDDAIRRLETSELYHPDERFNVHVCNSTWRLWLYSQKFSDRSGGEADTWLTRNIYIRPVDVARNRILPPSGVRDISDAAHRPLSYFLAHEATHILESRAFGRLMTLTHPKWMVEGYADYVGKGGDFDFGSDRRLLQRQSPVMDYGKSGLYRIFHLEVAQLIGRDHWTVRQMFERNPAESDVRRRIGSRSRRPPDRSAEGLQIRPDGADVDLQPAAEDDGLVVLIGHGVR